MQSTQPMPPTRRRPSTAVAVGLAIAGALTIPLVAAQHASAAPVQFSAVLLASDETTPVTAADAAAVGTADVTIDAGTGQICVAIATSGLSGAITAAHIHSGGAGVAGPVVVPLPTGTGTASGCVESTPAQAASIVAAPNMFYVNVHTAANAGGAARGQLTASVFAATLTGAAEAPGPGDSDGTGTAVVAVDTTANRACVVFQVANITLPAAMAHIHSGVIGVAGPVIVPFANAPTTATAGSCGSAAAAVISGIVAAPAGNYVNIHTSDFGNGAVRGQLSVRTATVPIATSPTTTIVSLTAPGATTTLAPGATTSALPTTTTAIVSSVASTLPPTTTVAATVATTALPAVVATPAEPVAATPAFTG